MSFLYTNAQIREIEALIIQNGLDTEEGLMEKAGRAAYHFLRNRWPTISSIAVICGKGNNGGDGLVLARLLHEAGLSVFVITLTELDKYKGSSLQALLKAQQAGLPIAKYHADLCFSADLIVDAILGSGLNAELKSPYLNCVEAINAAQKPVLALDVPTGVEADTGAILGIAVNATATLSFMGLKQGLFTHNAPTVTGEIFVDYLGVSKELQAKIEHSAELLGWQDVKPLLPRRVRDAHKGDYGHVLVVGGDYGMGGAVRMAAEAAMRMGAGLVTVATRPEHLSIVSGMRPEVMCYRCCEEADLRSLLEHATTVVIGPGLGKTDWAKGLLEVVLESNLPKVLDADALNLLALSPRPCINAILTPHPGEAARLLQSTAADIQANRFKAARELYHQYDSVIVLKGSGTIIDGPSDIPYVCASGNPGMATAGMGDILTGMIGGLLAQGLALQTAAEAAVFIHATAADKAANVHGERGMLATDVLNYLPALINPYMCLSEHAS